MALTRHNKYEVDSNTYVAKDIMVDGDDFASEIGDLKTADGFYPQYKLKRWGNEANFSARIKGSAKLTPTIDGDKIVYTTPEYTARFYNVAEGFEFDIIQHVKPASRVIEFTIRHKELNFFYQPELTAEQIAEGVERPDDIVGSYAVYHKSKSHHILGQTNYKAGKAFHIKRPWVEDATGKRVWGTLLINPKTNSMAIGMPKKFYDTAIWPVKWDPTFGFSSVGASTANSITGRAYGHGNADEQYTASSGDTVTDISMHVRNTNDTAELGVYDKSGGGNDGATLLGTGSITAPSTSGTWQTATGLSISLTAGNVHFIAYQSGNGIRRYFDNATTVGDSTEDLTASGGSLNATWAEGATDDERVSLYATYTTGGGPTGIVPLRRRIEGY